MSALTLREVLPNFLAGYIPTSKQRYHYELIKLLDFLGPESPVSRVAPAQLNRFGESLDKKKYATATYNSRVKSAKTFFNWCIDQGLITENPAQYLKVRKEKGLVDANKAMADKDLNQLLNYLMVINDLRMVCLALFCADTGCRRGGVATLRWNQVDFTKRTAVVLEKGNATRPVPFGAICADALRAWHKLQGGKPHQFVFTKFGEPIQAASISRLLRRFCVRAGVRGRGIHSLRHRKGFQFAEARLSPATCQLLMGHSQVETTLKSYYRRDWESIQAAGDELAVKAAPTSTPKLLPFPSAKSS